MTPSSPSDERTIAESCGGGRHNPLPSGVCEDCGQPAGSVCSTEPYDYPAARRELELVHNYIRSHGLEQSEVDGEWGTTDGYWQPEWNEAGNTVEALREIGRIEYTVGVFEEAPGTHVVRHATKHEVQLDVEEFHRVVVGVDDETTPAIRRPELRAELIREEARETIEAIERGDLVEAIDGMCDLLCVVYGTATEFGIDLAPFWDEVHRTNMAKAGGPVRDDGKRLKPPGWTPPDIAGVLRRTTEGDA